MTAPTYIRVGVCCNSSLRLPLGSGAPLRGGVPRSLWERVAGPMSWSLHSLLADGLKWELKHSALLERKINSQASANCSNHFGRVPSCGRVGVTAFWSMGTSISGNSPSPGYLHSQPAQQHPGSCFCLPQPQADKGCAVGGRQKAPCPRHTGWHLSSSP